jgi:hypothetical protein
MSKMEKMYIKWKTTAKARKPALFTRAMVALLQASALSNYSD